MTCSAHLNTLADLPPVAVKIILWVSFFFFICSPFWDSCTQWRCFHSTRKMKLKTFGSMISSREKCQAFFFFFFGSRSFQDLSKWNKNHTHCMAIKVWVPRIFFFFFFSRAVAAQVALWWSAHRRRIMWKNEGQYLQFSCINSDHFSFQSVHHEPDSVTGVGSQICGVYFKVEGALCKS